MNTRNNKPTFLFSMIAAGFILFSCGAPGACDCKENDSLGSKADSTITNDCYEAFEALSREEKNEYLEEFKACK
tara:strand:- start:23 stop:244 length:222 start_codon:yes stop_codon:yes gene_type:complete